MPLIQTAADWALVPLRSQRILWVLWRYALIDSPSSLSMEIGRRGFYLLKGSKRQAVPLDAVFGKNLAKACIALGPSFIKLGQMLATRSDLVGEPAATELRILFDRVPPLPLGVIKKIIIAELGDDTLKSEFKRIHTKPIGSASLSQVHQAELKDGTPVILKVQKPGAARLVRVDLHILGMWATSLSPIFGQLDLRHMYKDFKKATLKELDFRQEAKNIDRFQKNYFSIFKNSDVVFPKYYKEFSTEKVLVMEPMRGKKMSDLKKGTTVARKAAKGGMTAVLEQVFEHGFFHADPHAGNVFFLQDSGKVGFIDLGLVGQLEPKDRRHFLQLLMAILKRDRKELAVALYDLGEPSKKTDFKKFQASINELLDEVKSKGLENFRIQTVVNRLLAIARKHKIYIPNRYVLMLRSFLIIEGVAKTLDPKISLFRIAPPILMKSLIKSYNPLNVLKKMF